MREWVSKVDYYFMEEFLDTPKEKICYMRSHWLKIPPLLLIKHLTVELFRNFTKKEESYTP